MRRYIPLILEDADNELSQLMRSELHSLFDEWSMMESLIKQHDRAIEQFARADEQTTLLMTLLIIKVCKYKFNPILETFKEST